MFNIILRRNEDGTIRLREDKPETIDVEMRNNIFKYNQKMVPPLTGMSRKFYSMIFSLPQQETIDDNWKIYLYHVYEWDDSFIFGDKTMTYKDINATNGK